MVWIHKEELFTSAWIRSILENTKRIDISLWLRTGLNLSRMLRILKPETIVLRPMHALEDETTDYNAHPWSVDIVRSISVNGVHTIHITDLSEITSSICVLLQNAASSLKTLKWISLTPLKPNLNCGPYPVHLERLTGLHVVKPCSDSGMHVLCEWTRLATLVYVTYRPPHLPAYMIQNAAAQPLLQQHGTTIQQFRCRKWTSTYGSLLPLVQSIDCDDLSSCNGLPDSVQRITTRIISKRG